MNQIPCSGCAMPGGCRQDKKCRRPETGLDHAITEARAAIVAMEAAAKRLNEATANLAAALVIQQAQE